MRRAAPRRRAVPCAAPGATASSGRRAARVRDPRGARAARGPARVRALGSHPRAARRCGPRARGAQGGARGAAAAERVDGAYAELGAQGAVELRVLRGACAWPRGLVALPHAPRALPPRAPPQHAAAAASVAAPHAPRRARAAELRVADSALLATELAAARLEREREHMAHRLGARAREAEQSRRASVGVHAEAEAAVGERDALRAALRELQLSLSRADLSQERTALGAASERLLWGGEVGELAALVSSLEPAAPPSPVPSAARWRADALGARLGGGALPRRALGGGGGAAGGGLAARGGAPSRPRASAAAAVAADGTRRWGIGPASGARHAPTPQPSPPAAGWSALGASADTARGGSLPAPPLAGPTAARSWDSAEAGPLAARTTPSAAAWTPYRGAAWALTAGAGGSGD